MLEAKGDLWELGENADAIVITTNGTVKRDGTNVMGGGCALEAAERFPFMPFDLGQKIQKRGNNVHVFHYRAPRPVIVSFPTKENVSRGSILPLIMRSAAQLVERADDYDWNQVVMPRPGCGLGGLNWDTVGPMLQDILDDRFTVVTYG